LDLAHGAGSSSPQPENACARRVRRPAAQGSVVALAIAAILALAGAAAAAEAAVLEIDKAETAGISGFRAMWDVPVLTTPDGVRAIKDDQVKDRGGAAVWAPALRANGTKPGAMAFDAIHRRLLIRFPDAAERIAERMQAGYAVAKVELVLPFADEELWPEGDTNQAPFQGGYVYRANWGVDAMYRAVRPTWHAVAWALRKPWKADAALGPTFNAHINGAGYWAHFGAEDDKADRVPRPFGPTPVNYKEPAGRMDVTAALADKAFGDTPAARLRQLADCGFLVRKWETYDARYYTGAYEWGTGTGCRAIVINSPKLVVTFEKRADAPKPGPLPPPADIAKLADALKASGKGGRPTAAMPTREELQKLAEKHRVARPDWMPEWQWQRVKELLTAEAGPQVAEEPFWFQFVPPHILNRCRVDDQGKPQAAPNPEKAYEAWVDEMLGKPFRGWYGFDAGPALLPWFVYRDAMPAPAQEWYKDYWTAWLMPDRPAADTEARRRSPAYADGPLIHPMADDPRVGGVPNPDPVSGRFDTYYAKTGDWRGNKSFYRSGFNYAMSTTNFNNTASMGALLGGAVIGSKYAIEDGRHGQANFPLKLWTWFDGSTQEELDDYYFAVTLRAQKMVADFGPEPVDRMLGRSMLLKSLTLLADDYHPGLRRYVAGSSRTALYHRLATQDGLYGVLHTLSRRGTLTDLGETDLPEGELKFGHEFPPAEVARQASQSAYAPAWYQHVIDEKTLPFEVTAAYKMWGGHNARPLMRRTYLGRNYGLASVNAQTGIIPIIAQWRRQPRQVETSRELGTMLMRVGVNQTRWVSDAPGWMAAYGQQAVLQQGPKMLVVASPWGYGDWLNEKRGITSLQSSIAFFNYEKPAPTWEIYVDGQRVTALPFKAKAGQRIAIRDGVTFIGVVPLPSTNLGRTDEVVLHEGEPQTYLDRHRATAALVIDNYFLQGEKPLAKEANWDAIDRACGGFAVEYADVNDYKDFAAFRQHLAEAKLSLKPDAGRSLVEVAYESGKDTLAMGVLTACKDNETLDKLFTYQRAGGKDAYLPPGIERDSPFNQQGRTGRLEKGGAVLRSDPGQLAVLQCDAASGAVAGYNPLAELNRFSLQAPGGLEVTADGKVGIAFVTVQPKEGSLAIEHGFVEEQEREKEAATSLLVFGLKPETAITLNGQVVKQAPSIAIDGRTAIVIPLGKNVPDAGALAERYRAARRALEQARQPVP
jgi:hypothetical protein